MTFQTTKCNRSRFFRFSWIAASLLLANTTIAQPPIEMGLRLGSIADYGASPWYSQDILIGSGQLRLALDNGADFIWATSTECNTAACNAHQKVETDQDGFQWLDKTPAIRSFGPWGDMTTWTGSIGFYVGGVDTPPLAFFASTDYEGSQFQYLAWDGGIGLPARSDRITAPSAFLPKVLVDSGYISNPMFSQVTNPGAKTGVFLFGDLQQEYILRGGVATTLPPKPAPGTDDAWGTELTGFSVGDVAIEPLSGAIFFLDTGSSRFKGDSQYVLPILEALFKYADSSGNPIFEKIMQGDNWVSLAYVNGAPEDYKNLPNITMQLGTNCGEASAQGAIVTLSPEQYSYKVEVGDRAGQWVLAFRILDKIGGLLVGSTFLDLFYVSYEYNVDDQKNYTQGNMTLYAKSTDFGPGPASYQCRSSN